MKNRNTIFTAALLVPACIALLPVAQARQLSEDRGNGNSAADNVDALNLSTTGSDNTAHGWFSLFSNTTGSLNTADGFQALYSNTEGSANTGSVGVTGWASDDIEVVRVQILRDAHPSDPPGAVVAGKVFIGDASFVEGARSDIERPSGISRWSATSAET